MTLKEGQHRGKASAVFYWFMSKEASPCARMWGEVGRVLSRQKLRGGCA